MEARGHPHLATSQLDLEGVIEKHIVIIGSGHSGLCMAIQLRKNGFNDFIVLEKASSLGGTWRDNTYPGAACDIEAFWYQFSFAIKPDWSRRYVRQPEILQYMKDVTSEFGIDKFIKYHSEVESMVFLEPLSKWVVSCKDGSRYLASFVVSGMGALHRPNVPPFTGRSTFKGPQFHTAEWNHKVPLNGKRIAVIGSAASAAQVVPEIAPLASQLFVFQRTPNYCLPRKDHRYWSWILWLFKTFPFLAWLYYCWLWLFYGELILLTAMRRRLPGDPILSLIWRRNLNKSVKDPILREKLTPTYPLGAKRILLTDDFYSSLARPNVSLVTEGIHSIEPHGIRTDKGTLFEADVIIYATGFNVIDPLECVHIMGTSPKSLRDFWRENGLQAYRGILVSSYPNLFFLIGPNSGLGHGSMIAMIEAQVEFVITLLKHCKASNYKTVDVRKSAMDEYNVRLQKDSQGTVWDSDVRSWYKDASGRNFAIWPNSTWSYTQLMRNPNFDHLQFDS